MLFVVALPIGNSGDLSPRTKKILESVDIIAAEDTRKFELLAKDLALKHKKVYSHHNFNENTSADELLKKLIAGSDVALVTDAGTPGISDPGYHLVQKCFERGIRVVPIPGASSVVTALSASPIGGDCFGYLGFAPNKSSERKSFFERMAELKMRAVVFETPHRILEHLTQALEQFGDIKVFVGRELTKTYEELVYKPLTELITHFENPRGEFVLVYPPIKADLPSREEVEGMINQLLTDGASSKEILERLKARSGLRRQDLYDLIQRLRNRGKVN